MFENRIRRYFAEHRLGATEQASSAISQSQVQNNPAFIPLPQELAATEGKMTAMAWIYFQAFEAAQANSQTPPPSAS